MKIIRVHKSEPVPQPPPKGYTVYLEFDQMAQLAMWAYTLQHEKDFYRAMPVEVLEAARERWPQCDLMSYQIDRLRKADADASEGIGHEGCCCD